MLTQLNFTKSALSYGFLYEVVADHSFLLDWSLLDAIGVDIWQATIVLVDTT